MRTKPVAVEPVVTDDSWRSGGMVDRQDKSGPGGAGNTVIPGPNHCKGVAMVKPTVAPTAPSPRAEIADRLAECTCPYCVPPEREPISLGAALPDVLDEMRRIQREAGR